MCDMWLSSIGLVVYFEEEEMVWIKVMCSRLEDLRGGYVAFLFEGKIVDSATKRPQARKGEIPTLKEVDNIFIGLRHFG